WLDKVCRGILPGWTWFGRSEFAPLRALPVALRGTGGLIDELHPFLSAYLGSRLGRLDDHSYFPVGFSNPDRHTQREDAIGTYACPQLDLGHDVAPIGTGPALLSWKLTVPLLDGRFFRPRSRPLT